MKTAKQLLTNTLIIMLKGILSVLFLLMPSVLFAQEQPKLVGPDVTVKAGQLFKVSVQDAPAGSGIQWTWDSRLKCIKTFSHILSCKLERSFLTEESLNVEVGATIDKLKWSGTGVVTIDRTGGIKTKTTWETGVSDVGKLEKINGLLKELQSGELSEARILDFYNKMGVEKLSMKDLIEFKDSVIKGKHKELGYYKHGVDFWNQNFRPMEMQIMNVRKEMVLKAWDATIKQYFRDNPEGCKIYKMDVGGWVKETLEKMKFEGDIDFTIIMERSEDAILIRNIFEGQIQKIFNLDMVAVDAIATAHRAATLSVYIGEYGADWAEKDAIKRGKMQAIEYEDGRIVIREEVPPTEKQTIFSILKNNEGMRRGQPDMLAQIKQEKADPKPTYTMEPGISLEFLRHVTEDAIHQRLAPHEKLIRICKYLDRSAKEHASIMKTFGVEPQPINPALIKASEDIIAVKQDPKLNPEETYLKIMLIGETLMGSAWLNDPEAFLQKLGQRAAEVMKHNIEMALEQRLKKIEGAKDLQEKDAEKRKLLDELENEFKAFAEGNVEFPPKAKSAMIELATYFKNKGLAFKLSPEEQKRIAELLKRLTDNPKASRTWMAMIWQHVQTLHAGADTAINEMNNIMDVLDNHTIGKLRMTEGIEIEVGGKKIKPMNIKAVNAYLNGTVLGTIGNNTAYKGINLAMETKAYWDAVMNAETWSEGFKNLGYEVMTRRLPGYALTETFVMGNYGRMSLELVYLFCPLVAVPEGLYGMAQGAAEWGVGKMNQWRYEELVETLYDSATFEKYGEKEQFKEWRMTGFTYDCPPVISPKIDAKTKSKEGLFDLVNSCKKVSIILYSQIKNHPAVVQFEEMLSNPAVSSGKASIMGVGTGWPYQYAGLSKYGEGLYKIYRKKIDDVTLEYFKGVIDGLEKRKGWEVGTGYAKIMEIEKELGCTKPIMEYTKGVSITGHILGGDNLKEDVKNDAKRFQEVVDTYNKLKESNKAIAGLKERWQAEFLEGLKPGCTPASIKETGKRASELAGRLTTAVEEAKAYVDNVIGKDAKEKDAKEEDIRPITKARLCMAYYSYLKGNSSSEYSRCYEDYQQAKAEVDKKAVNVVMAELALPKVEFCVGEKVTPAVSYNKPCDECRVVAWEILDDQGRVEERLQPGTKTTWKPRSAGDKTIRAKVEIEFVKDVVKFERTPEKKVSVKPEDQCPRLKIALDSGGITEITKDSQITVSAKPLSLAPGSPPVKRYFWTEDGQEKPSTETPDYIVSGKGKGNRLATLEAVARDADGNLSEKAAITIRITDQATAGLLVKIVPVNMEAEKDGPVIIRDNESATFKAVVSTKIPLNKKESGELIFRWSADKTTVFGEDKNTATFKGEGWSGKKVQIDVVVMDAKKREGTASIIVDVKASKGLTVLFEDHPKTVTERDVLKLRVMEPIKTTGNYRYTWKRNGAVVRDKMEPDYFDVSDFQGLAGKSVTFVVEVFDDKGRTGSAETTIKVTEPKPEVEKLLVTVKPESDNITQADTRSIVCSVQPFKDSGRLTFNGFKQAPGVTSITMNFSGRNYENLVPVSCEVTDEMGRKGEAVAHIFVKKKAGEVKPEDKPIDKPVTTPGDPKKLAEEKNKWLKGIPDYLQTLIELDEKTFMAFEKAVRKDVLGGVAIGKYGAPPVPKECSGKSRGEMVSRIGEIEKVLPNYYKCGMIKEDVLTKQKIWGCVEDSQYNTLSSEQNVLEICLKGRDAATYWEFKCLDIPAKERREHKVLLKAKLAAVKDSKAYNNYQEYDAFGIYKDYLKIVDELKSTLTLPDPIPGSPALPWAYSSSCGAVDGVSSDQTALTVTLKAAKQMLKREEPTNITAEVKGGRSPYSFVWKGNSSGKGNVVSFMSMKPGEHTLSVEVADAAGNKGTASITLKVGGVTGEIQGLAEKVVFGTWQQKIWVKFTADGKEIPIAAPDKKKNKQAEYRVIWQADPAISFYPATSEDGKTDALFDQMGPRPNGTIKIWAEIQQFAGGAYSTIGEAPQKEVRVVPPKFKWTFAPEKGKGKVGQEVKVTITTEPKIKDEIINYEWSWPESSNRMEYEKNASVIGFVPKDPKPFKLLVAPKSASARVNIDIGGGLLEEYQAGSYTVSVGKPRNIGSKPQIWVCDTQLGSGQKCGLQEKEYEFAVYHNISMNADVAPAPSETPRFQWVVSPEGCRVHNELSQELTVDCSNTGAYTATVTVRDKDKTVLGTGSGSFSVTISQQMLNESKKKAEEAKKDQTDKEEAQKKLNQALEALRQGRTDEAIKLADEAAKTDKKLAEPVFKEIVRECKKLGNDAISNRDFKTAVKRLEDAVRLDPSDKEAKDKLAQARKFAGIWPQVEQKAKEFDALISQKKVWSAYKKMLEIQEMQKEMSGGMSNPLSKKITDDLNKALKEYNDFSQETSSKHTEYFKSQDWDAMLKNAQDMMKRELSPADDKEAKSRLDFAQQMLNEQKGKAEQEKRAKEAADKLWQEGSALYDQKKPAEALKIFNESLKQWPDAKRQEYVKSLENAMVQSKANASKLRSEGEALQNQGKLTDAVGKYKQSLSYWPDRSLEEHIRNVEGKIAGEKKQKEASDRFWEEGKSLFDHNRHDDAVRKFRESLAQWPDPKRTEYVNSLEKEIGNKKATAARLRSEGEALQNQGRLSDAVGKYRESLKHWPDRQLEEHIVTVENKIREDRDKEHRKAEAKRLRDEGARLQGQGLVREAIAKYRESLTYWNDPELEKHIRELEERIARTPVTPDSSSSSGSGFYHVDLTPYGGKKGSPRKVKDIEIDDSSWIRLKGSDENRRSIDIRLPRTIQTQAIAVVTRLDDAHYLAQGRKITTLMVTTDKGSHTFEFKAGVNTGTWNRQAHGADHQYPKDADIGAENFLAVFRLPATAAVTQLQFGYMVTDAKPWSGHAPGFILKGLTLITSGSVLVDSNTGSSTHTVIPTEKPVQQGSVIFNNGNIGGVSSGPTSPTIFTLDRAHVITLIQNYHNFSGGAAPGTISLRDQSGRTYGPWPAKGLPGQGGVKKAYWDVNPNITLQAGTYTVIDSNPKTWSQNSESKGRGFTRVEGYPSSGSGSVQQAPPASGGSITVTLHNASRENVHIYEKGGSPSPSNRLTPGQRVTVSAKIKSGWIEFCAGRSGKDIECAKKGVDPDYAGYTYTVKFDESNRYNKVIITKGLK